MRKTNFSREVLAGQTPSTRSACSFAGNLILWQTGRSTELSWGWPNPVLLQPAGNLGHRQVDTAISPQSPNLHYTQTRLLAVHSRAEGQGPQAAWEKLRLSVDSTVLQSFAPPCFLFPLPTVLPALPGLAPHASHLTVWVWAGKTGVLTPSPSWPLCEDTLQPQPRKSVLA